ncbi:MAG: metallophosphoesterase [Nitrospirota bacterium]|nr:metallophosphoesterase [Nitrospirota bacterium]
MSVFYLSSGLLVYGFLIEPYVVTVKNIDIHSERLANVLKGYKVVQISDLHISKYGRREKKVVKVLRNIDPDIVFFTGDAIEWGADFKPVLQFFRNVPAKIGVWAVLGNSDYSNAKEMCLLCHEPNSKSLLKKKRVRFLRNTNEVIKIKRTDGSLQPLKLAIIGVDDFVTGRADLKSSIRQIPREVPKILLSHSPDLFVEASRSGIDLLLAGHTHGGQIFIVAILGGVISSLGIHDLKYTTGLYNKGKTVMYVNSGIGTSIIPVRIGVPPQIAILNFK